MGDLNQMVFEAMNKLAKWRSIFAGWQLGTRAKGDPESDAVRDHREATILLRAEVNALTACLVEDGMIRQEDFQKALLNEARALDRMYEAKFPGCHTSEQGVVIEHGAAEWMKDLTTAR